MLAVLLLLVGCLLLSSSAEEALAWNITAVTPGKLGGRPILANVCGRAGRGRLHAIMGPSGSGKSTLLNALAGVTPKRSVSLEGFVHSAYDSEPVFVQQEDLLFAQLTVAETLDTSVALRNAEDSIASRAEAVESKILDLGLKKSRDVSARIHPLSVFHMLYCRLRWEMLRREVSLAARRSD